jgi:hypothetical protein
MATVYSRGGRLASRLVSGSERGSTRTITARPLVSDPCVVSATQYEHALATVPTSRSMR